MILEDLHPEEIHIETTEAVTLTKAVNAKVATATIEMITTELREIEMNSRERVAAIIVPKIIRTEIQAEIEIAPTIGIPVVMIEI